MIIDTCMHASYNYEYILLCYYVLLSCDSKTQMFRKKLKSNISLGLIPKSMGLRRQFDITKLSMIFYY